MRACQFGLSLNLDLAATAFVMGNQPLHDLVAEVCGAGTPNQMAAVMASKKELRNLREGLRGIKVVGPWDACFFRALACTILVSRVTL